MAPGKKRKGLTLFEMMVVIIVAGLALAIVAPSLVLRPHSPEVAIQDMVNTARRVSARKGQSLSLRVTSSGRWILRSSATGDIMENGKLGVPSPRSFSVRVTPLGMCLPETDNASNNASALDPLDCRWRDSLGGAR